MSADKIILYFLTKFSIKNDSVILIYIIIYECQFLVTFFHDFLLNHSTKLSEIWNIITRMKMEENCRKKYLKSCTEKKLQRHKYVHTIHKSDSLSYTKKCLSVLYKSDSLSQTKNDSLSQPKVTLCLRQKMSL